MQALRAPNHRFAALALSATALFAGTAACGNDSKPTAAELRAEAREQAGKAAEDVKETAEDAADKGGEVAEDVADGPDESKSMRPSVRILAPSNNARVAAGDVAIKLEVANFTIVAADGDTSGKSGHFHVFVDRDPVAVGATIPKEASVVHSAENPVTIPGLTTGKHTLVVVLGDGAHTRLDTDAVEVTVEVT